MRQIDKDRLSKEPLQTSGLIFEERSDSSFQFTSTRNLWKGPKPTRLIESINQNSHKGKWVYFVLINLPQGADEGLFR